MKPEQVKKLLPVLQAYAEGKTVQVKNSGTDEPWEDYRALRDGKDADFENKNWKWRVKPEPREFWINRYLIHCTVYHTRESANITGRGDRLECVHVREVL